MMVGETLVNAVPVPSDEAVNYSALLKGVSGGACASSSGLAKSNTSARSHTPR